MRVVASTLSTWSVWMEEVDAVSRCMYALTVMRAEGRGSTRGKDGKEVGPSLPEVLVEGDWSCFRDIDILAFVYVYSASRRFHRLLDKS